MNIQLKTGNTVNISTYEWLFILKDDDVEAFLESCTADNLGTYIDNPFSSRTPSGKLEIEENEETDELEN